VNRLADSLSKLGLKKGERAAIIEVNCHQFVEALFATVKLGAIFVPLNFRIREDELKYLVNKAEPKILFVGSRYADMVNSIKAQLPSVERFVIIGGKDKGNAGL
jgi:acyl-CoA synthetase (AMP-forming)/AMP-acid ligase II